ncbi:hypothetical protein BC826DRAFT_972359 [Russula brevipes]|nr:hypothetical protein BC826DRAFT_972359 [Russula brevipes]
MDRMPSGVCLAADADHRAREEAPPLTPTPSSRSGMGRDPTHASHIKGTGRLYSAPSFPEHYTGNSETRNSRLDAAKLVRLRQRQSHGNVRSPFDGRGAVTSMRMYQLTEQAGMMRVDTNKGTLLPRNCRARGSPESGGQVVLMLTLVTQASSCFSASRDCPCPRPQAALRGSLPMAGHPGPTILGVSPGGLLSRAQLRR